MLEIDGRQGEGGGQVLRTSLSLSALTQRPFRLTHIRAKRKKPGLKPQHLTGVRAVARVCGAAVTGDKLESMTLTFSPQMVPQGGHYHINVAKASQGGSAGSVALVLQAILWPLLFAAQPSTVVIEGGTHVNFSPHFHYVRHVFAPAVAQMGANLEVTLDRWGWYPVGGGRITAVVTPSTGLNGHSWLEREGAPIRGVAAVTNLPAHIPHRMARRAHNLLTAAGYEAQIEAVRESGAGMGAGIVLWHPTGGVLALGRKGLPADKVAETAVGDLMEFLEEAGAVDPYLADQLLLPMALAKGRSRFTTTEVTMHTLTNAELIQQWLDVSITIDGKEGQPGTIVVEGCDFSLATTDGS